MRKILVVLAMLAAFPLGFVGSMAIAQVVEGEHVACVTVSATAQTPPHELGVDGDPVHTIPGDQQMASDEACVTATDQTVTEHETVTERETVTVTEPNEPPPTQPNIDLLNQGWTCTGPQDRALVRITITSAAPDGIEAINHRENCTGEIDRVEILAFKGHDMLDFNNATVDTHDLHYGGGFVRARGASPAAHQDCIQFTNGVDARNVLIEDVVFSGCDTQYIITSTSLGQNVVCDGCTFLPEHNGLQPPHTAVNGGPATAFILTGGNIGTRNSLVCIGSRFGHGVRVDGNANAIGWIEQGAVGGTDAAPAPGSGNILAPVGDPRCAAPG